jgi:hypothetical protein
MTRIGVVIHGPEVIDSGRAKEVLDAVLPMGDVTSVLGGTMGRAAVIDAGLENLIDISSNHKPSMSIIDLEFSCDVILLVNEAKSRQSALAFGALVYERAGHISIPLFQIEYGAADDHRCSIIPWTVHSHPLMDLLKDKLNAGFLHPLRDIKNITTSGDIIRRRVADVKPNEYVTINGTVIGSALSSDIEIISRSGKIIELKGGRLKPHGVEKLDMVDLSRAIIRSGPIRTARVAPRVLEHCASGYAVIIDHLAEKTFEIAVSADLAVVVGDDTTAIAGDLLTRIGIPMIGIIDGDKDGLKKNSHVPPGSVIIRVMADNDDIVGKKVKDTIFKGKERMLVGDNGFPGILSDVLDLAGSLVEEVKRY